MGWEAVTGESEYFPPEGPSIRRQFEEVRVPNWGLTEAQVGTKPWGLDPGMLAPAKTVTDPVHGDVYLNRLEALLVDSSPMQRLRRVRQLGNTHLVYPGATHTRFSHALGTMRAAQDLLDAISNNRTGPHHTRGLLDEWHDQGVLDTEFAKATVLARLGALLHDLCHVPLGHTIEDDLQVLIPHDANAARFERLWTQLDDDARDAIEDAQDNLLGEVRMLVLSKEKDDHGRTLTPASSEYPFVSDIVGNTICADLMDYLQRDHLYTGLPLAVGHRFVNAFYVMSGDHVHYPKRMVVRIERAGHQRADVVTELVKYLRYRYELTERVLTHHAKAGADAMIGKLLEMWSDEEWASVAAEVYPAATATVGRDDVDVLKQAIATAHPEPLAQRPGAPALTDGAPLAERFKAIADTDARVRARLEDVFLRRSDDGILEHLSEAATMGAPKRRRAIGTLAEAVLDRRLFKLIGRAEGRADKALAREKHDRFGGPDQRRTIEREAARKASLDHGWQVVVWLPEPNMRLKVAGVLVDDGDGLAPLSRVSDAGHQIVTQHKGLWSIAIYADASLRPDGAATLKATRKADVVLAVLQERMDLRMVRWDGEVVRSLDRLSVDTVGEHANLKEEQRLKLLALVPAALGGNDTFDGMLKRTWAAAANEGWVGPRTSPGDL